MITRYEERLTITGPNWTIHSTPDVYSIDDTGTEGKIVENKFGRTEPLESAIALQSSAYALGLWQKYPTLKRVTCYIVYPRLERLYTYEIFSDPQYGASFEEIRNKIHEIIIQCEAWNAPLVPGPHCKYCKAIAFCPKVFSDADNEALMLAGEYLPAAKIADLLDRLPVLEQRIDVVRKVAKAYLRQGVEIPGYHIQLRNGNRRIVDWEAAYERLRGEMSKEEFKQALRCSVTELENIYASMHPELKKSLVRAQLEAVLGDTMMPDSPVEVLKRK